MSRRTTVTAGVDALVLTGADGAESFTCSFLSLTTGLPQTQVTLQNRESSAQWVGTLITTDNQ